MSKQKNITKKIIAILLLGLFIMSELSTVAAVFQENSLESNKYVIAEETKTISRIVPETTIEEFKTNLNASQEDIAIYKDKTLQQEQTEGYIQTGMAVKIEGINAIYELVVIGDINQDGLMDQIDLNLLIKHVIGHEELTGLSQKAADILFDQKINQIDITALIRYIVYHDLNFAEIERPAKPEIEIISGEQGQEDWYTSDVEIQITENQESEVKIGKTIYEIKGIEEGVIKQSKEINLTQEGEFQIIAYSYSNIGVKSEINSQNLKIDKTAPTLELEVNAQNEKIEVKAKANDKTSGIKQYSYFLGTKTEEEILWQEPVITQEPSHTFQNLQQGKEYQLKVEVSDKAGNVATKTTKAKTGKVPQLIWNKDGNGSGDDNSNVKIEISEGEPTNENVIIKVELDPEVDPEGKYEIEYSKDGGETWEKYDPETGIIVEENGNVDIRLTDGETHGEGITVEINNIDKKPPQVNLEVKSTTKAIEVKVKAEDDGSGIKEYTYQIGKKDENGEIIWEEKIISSQPNHKFENLETEQEYEIKVEVKDNAGNVTTKQITEKVEKIPELTWNKDGNGNGEGEDNSNVKIEISEGEPTNENVIIQVELDPEVDPKGKYEIEYSKDGGETWEKYDPETGIIVEENGNVDIRLTDGEEHGKQITVEINNIDKTAPTLEITTENTSKTITVNAIAKDEGSGIKQYSYQIGERNENGEIIWSDPIISNEPSHQFTNLKKQTDYEIKVEVSDIAGNVTTKQITKATNGIPDLITNKNEETGEEPNVKIEVSESRTNQ